MISNVIGIARKIIILIFDSFQFTVQVFIQSSFQKNWHEHAFGPEAYGDIVIFTPGPIITKHTMLRYNPNLVPSALFAYRFLS